MYHISIKLGKERRKRRKEKVGKRKEEKEERKGPREMNSGVNASLRFAFTSKVEKGAFYNRKQVRKNQQEEVIIEREVSIKRVFIYQKGVCLSKGCLYYQRCQIKERVYMKKGKGGKEKQNEYQNTIAKEGDVITKRIPKR